MEWVESMGMVANGRALETGTFATAMTAVNCELVIEDAWGSRGFRAGGSNVPRAGWFPLFPSVSHVCCAACSAWVPTPPAYWFIEPWSELDAAQCGAAILLERLSPTAGLCTCEAYPAVDYTRTCNGTALRFVNCNTTTTDVDTFGPLLAIPGTICTYTIIKPLGTACCIACKVAPIAPSCPAPVYSPTFPPRCSNNGPNYW